MYSLYRKVCVHSVAPIVALALICIIPLWLQNSTARHRREEQNRRHGKFTARQILARSDRLCHELLPQESVIRLAAEWNTLPIPQGGRRNCWTVSCTDLAGIEVAHLVWNADTGDLCTVGCKTPSVSISISRLTRVEAIQRAREWLRTLGSAGHWQLVSSMQGKQPWWLITLRTPGHLATLSLDAESGDLLSAYLLPEQESSHPMAMRGAP